MKLKFGRAIGHFFLMLLSLGFLGLLGAGAIAAFLLINYTKDLPDFTQLADYQPPVVSRVYTSDGQLMAEFAEQKRIFVPISSIPDLVKHAFMAAEDQNFYKHRGVDIKGIARAVFLNLGALGSDKRLVGASTITQQVAKNMLLTNEVSFERKFKEAILAIRMERVLSKDRILELYLNEIYLGRGAYGVAAAAQTYFNKSLDELTPEEAAYLGALPKAPNNYDPVRNRERALERRNAVLGEMEDLGYITKDQAELAKIQPLVTVDAGQKQAVRAPYFAEEIRRFLGEQRGLDSLYKDGLIIRTTLDPDLQTMAEQAFRIGITRYDRRHGYRGAVKHLDAISGWASQLLTVPLQAGMLPDWQLAVVTKKTKGGITIGTDDGQEHKLHPDDVTWVADGVSVGDVVMASPKSYLDDKPKKAPKLDEDGNPIPDDSIDDSEFWRIRQVPAVQGGLIVMDPYTGRVLAMQGGWDYEKSEFNRATQAQRQVGSAFKPYVYLSALEDGYTPVTKILDAPISFSMGYGQGVWTPGNYEEGEYGGPTTIRQCLEKSRNLPTVRLAAHLGMKRIAQTVERFGIYTPMQTYLANALGAQETTLLRMVTAYSMLDNGGQKITPSFIDRIQDRNGISVYSRDGRACADCGPRIAWTPGQPVPVITKDENLVTDPRIAFQMVNILEGVPLRGTAQQALSDIAPDYPMAGKTGTTNDQRDAWFIGFTPTIVVGMYVGYDEPKNLGTHETGGAVAAPMFRAFIDRYRDTHEAVPFRIPPGISLVQVNANSGERTSPSDPKAIWEAFLKEETDTGADETYTYDPNKVPDIVTPTDKGGAVPVTPSETELNPPAAQPDQTPAPATNSLGGTGGLY